MILIITPLFIFSQTNKGFTIGTNFAYLTGDSTSLPFSGIKPGLYGGMFWDISTGYDSFIEIGGLFSHQGVKYKNQYFDYGEKVTQTKTHNISYVKVPILWKQTWGDWYTSIGIYGEFKIRAKTITLIKTETATTVKTDTFYPTNFTNELRLYDVGFNFAIGIQTPISAKHEVFANLSYNIGLFALNPEVIRVENKMYNRFFTLNVGIIKKATRYNFR